MDLTAPVSEFVLLQMSASINVLICESKEYRRSVLLPDSAIKMNLAVRSVNS